MLAPKKVKHRKVHRGSMAGVASGNTEIHFGEYALKSLGRCWLTSQQIEAARIAMTRHVKRGGKIWIRVFPDKSYTKKPAETRMGSGKGAPEGWVAVVKPGRILFEMAGVPEPLAREAMRLAAHKLPIETRFIVKELQAELKQTRHRLFQDRVRFATRSLDNSNPLRAGRKRVARILTLLREAELKEQAATGAVKARRQRR